MSDVFKNDAIELRYGPWQEVLRDVAEASTFVSDPPYSERTHSAYANMAKIDRSSIAYDHMTEEYVAQLVAAWTDRISGWFVVLTDHVLQRAFEASLKAHNRYTFSPLSCVEPGSRVRVVGDGPSQWSVLAQVARPRTRAAQAWGALPGAYVVPSSETQRAEGLSKDDRVVGAKPLWLMRELVRDYSKPGDLIIDPFCGGGTTLLAAAMEGRRAIGAEAKREHFDIAVKRLSRGYQTSLFARLEEERAAEQLELPVEVSGE